MKKEKIIKYGNPILLVAIVALLGSIFTSSGKEWFETLNKPSNWIANYIIPIMWFIIYSLFIAYIICMLRQDKIDKKMKIWLVINGSLNILWCLVYFQLGSLLLGLIVIIINLISSWLLHYQIHKQNNNWQYYLLIYPTWLSIATCLNIATWILN